MDMANKFIRMAGIMLASAVLATGAAGLAPAASAAKAPISVNLDGKLQKYDQSPIILEGSTMVPLRGIFEGLGAKLAVSGKKITAVKGRKTVVLTIGEKTAVINGQKVTLAQRSVVLKGRTLVPLRFVGEALGAHVSWNASKSLVTITSQTPAELQLELDGYANGYVFKQDIAGLKGLMAEGWKIAQSKAPVLNSVGFRNEEMIRFFLDQGASVQTADLDENGQTVTVFDVVSYPYKFTATGYAETTEEADLATVKLLLSYKPDIPAMEKAYGSVLWHAILSGRASIVSELLKAGASVKANDAGDYFPPLIAATTAVDKDGKRLPSMVELLLKSGADANDCNCDASQDYTPLENASRTMYDEDEYGESVAYDPDPAVVKLLLQYGADPKRDHSLYEAVGAGSLEIAKLLLAAGADPNKVYPSAEETPLEYAKAIEDADMIALLEGTAKQA